MAEVTVGPVYIGGRTPTRVVEGHWIGFSKYVKYGNGKKDPIEEVVDIARGDTRQPVWRNVSYIPANYLVKHEFKNFDLISDSLWYQRMLGLMEQKYLDAESPNRQIYCEGFAPVRDFFGGCIGFLSGVLSSGAEPVEFLQDVVVDRFRCGKCRKLVEKAFVVRKAARMDQVMAAVDGRVQPPVVYHSSCREGVVRSVDLERVLVCRRKLWEMRNIDK